MNDLTGASGKSKTEGGVLSEDKSQKLLAKKMTPREIHRLKKMQESDKKAQVLMWGKSSFCLFIFGCFLL